MKYSFFIFVFFVIVSCSNNNQDQISQLSQQLDSTKILLDSLIKLQSSVSQQDTSEISAGEENSTHSENTVDSSSNRISEKSKRSTPEKTTENLKPTQTKFEAEPSAYFYANSDKLSVQVISGEHRSKDFVLFDPWGKETYRFKQRIESYSVTVDLVEWHSNGAIHKVKVHTNPGASMYWYDAVYTFGINNEPQWMVSTQHPQTTVSLESDNSYYWDEKTKSWKKQEVVIEQPVPRD
jgi:hypothetical protein